MQEVKTIKMPQSSGKKIYSLIQKEALGSFKSGLKACARNRDTTIKLHNKGKKRKAHWTIKISTSIYAKNCNEQSGKGFLL